MNSTRESWYRNRGGVRAAALVDGSEERYFGVEDEVWVPLDENGSPMLNARRLRTPELEAEGDYDCITSAIDLGLEGLGVREIVSPDLLMDALCYERFGWEAERQPADAGVPTPCAFEKIAGTHKYRLVEDSSGA